jgi:VWFA-related protein
MKAVGSHRLLWTVFLVLLISCGLVGQSPQSLPDAPQPQKLPPPPEPPPSESSSRDSAPLPATPPTTNSSGQPDSAGTPADTSSPTADHPASTVTEPVHNPSTPDTQRLYTISVTRTFIEIPVTVKDHAGHMVQGLVPTDFTVYEDGVRQKLAYFTSDPLPISAAVLIDVSMPDTALRRVQEGLGALQGAFSQYDQVAIYTYGNSVTRESGFDTVGNRMSAAINKIVETKHGTPAEVPVSGGPFEGGPTVNGRPFDPSTMQVPIVPHDRRVLNDAVLEAAMDLSKAPPARRRVIMIIGDGREDGSRSSYADVLKVLLSYKVGVYAIGVGAAAIPVNRKLAQINLPGTGVGNILPKYANATGGEVFSEFTRESIESAYSAVTVVARNQYTLGYYTQATLAENYRDIEVRVDHPGLTVTAKHGYYPLPPQRQ